MTTTTEDARHKIDLEFLGTTLHSAGVPSQLVEKSDEFPLHFLSVSIAGNNLKSPAMLQLMYIPTGESMTDSNLLQFFAYVPIPDEESSQDVAKFLEFLNTRTPMGYLARGDDGQLFFRYVYALPRFEVPSEVTFLEIFSLYRDTFDVFGSVLVELASGKINLQEAQKKVS